MGDTAPTENNSALTGILTRLAFLDQVGLGYLSLDRTSRTLSGGETMRVNLTSCLGSALTDTLFVLDEPSVGLHPRDMDRLMWRVWVWTTSALGVPEGQLHSDSRYASTGGT
jgi:excinuclease UvrABC ATPase subunit